MTSFGMPRPAELFDTGNPITADFAFVRWIGDRKGIEERTRIWNQTIVDRTEDLREWVKILSNVARRVKVMFAYANNHFGGFAPDTVELFKRLRSQQASVEPVQGVRSRLPVQPSLDFRTAAGHEEKLK